MPSAVIVRARLPGGLERLRRRSIGAADGVPAHLTMLYPFLAPSLLEPNVRKALVRVAARHRPFEYVEAGRAIWPDTVYVAVTPAARFVRLQSDLQAAFPAFPIYGETGDFQFVPHISIAEGATIHDPSVLHAPAWRALPRPSRAAAIEVIATSGDGRWRLVWRIPLGGHRGAARR